MAGYFVNRASTAVHDPLLARALVLENEGVRIAIVTCDLTNMPRGIVLATRQRISDEMSIPASHVMITATHAHTAPVVLSGWSRYALEGDMKQTAEAYAAELPGRIAASVKEALARLRPARMLSTTGQESTLAFQRRFHMKDGSVGWNPGKLNPNIVRPAGPIDPAVALVYLEGEDGQAIAVYVNYAIHLDTVGNTEISADLVYSLSESMKIARGRQTVTLFSMGCSGNINHVNTSSPHRQSGHGEAARIGITLAAAVLKSIPDLTPVDNPKLSAAHAIVMLDAVEPTAAERDEAHAARPQSGGTLVLAKAARTLEIEASLGKPFEAEVQVLGAGPDLAWIGLPGEIFVELGLDLKARAGIRWPIVSTQTNGALGYVPHRSAYPQGNYEVVSARVVAGSGEKLVETAVKLIQEGNRR